jgi:hypothetical protein
VPSFELPGGVKRAPATGPSGGVEKR